MVSTATYARRAEGDVPQRRDEDIVVFREADPLAVAPSPDARAFFEPSYDSVLETMIAHVVAVEGPIREAVRGTTADDEEAPVRMAREARLKQLRQAARERLEQAWRLSEPTP